MLKLGRTKLLVRDINIVSKLDKIREKNKRIDRYRKQYARRQIKKAKLKEFDKLDDSLRRRDQLSHSPSLKNRPGELLAKKSYNKRNPSSVASEESKEYGD